MQIVALVNDFLRKYGIEVKKYPSDDLLRRVKLLKYLTINRIFDVGANAGQYAATMRKLGFKEFMVSFEPVSDAFSMLKKRTLHDKKWSAVNTAIGDFDGEIFINIAANLQSSSILEMLPSHIKSAPDSVYLKKERIKIKKLDSIIDDYSQLNDNIFLKIDTQGYEKKVLEGAANSMGRIKGIQMEMSLAPLYKGEVLFFDMVEYMRGMGFRICSIESGFFDQGSGRLLQVDGIFIR